MLEELWGERYWSEDKRGEGLISSYVYPHILTPLYLLPILPFPLGAQLDNNTLLAPASARDGIPAFTAPSALRPFDFGDGVGLGAPFLDSEGL